MTALLLLFVLLLGCGPTDLAIRICGTACEDQGGIAKVKRSITSLDCVCQDAAEWVFDGDR